MDKEDVRNVRKEMGMSRNDFAQFLNVSLPAVKRWEEGKTSPKGPEELILVSLANKGSFGDLKTSQKVLGGWSIYQALKRVFEEGG